MVNPLPQLCSAWKKPNNQTILRTAAVPAFLNGRDFTDVCIVYLRNTQSKDADRGATRFDLLVASLVQQ